MERRRLQAAEFFEQGVYPAEVARRLGARRQSAHDWYKVWQAKGHEGLKSRGSAGKTCLGLRLLPGKDPVRDHPGTTHGVQFWSGSLDVNLGKRRDAVTDTHRIRHAKAI